MSRDGPPARPAPGRPRWRFALVVATDVAIALAVAAAVAIAVTGGFRGEIAGVTVSARGADRAFAVALVLVLARRRWAGEVGLFGSTPEATRRVVGRIVDRAADRGPDGGRRLRARAAGLAALGLVATGGVLLHRQIVRMDSVPDLGDPLFSLWRIGWVYRQLAGDPRPLFDANIFHPEPLTFTLSDSMLLPALTAAPLLAASTPPVVAYNIVFLSSFVLSGLAAFLLIARVTGSGAAAFIGGLYYGFHPFRFEHYSHLELQMTYWMPLALLALHRFLDTRAWRDALAAALCLVAQLYSSMYYGVFFPLYAAVVFGVVVLVTRPPLRPLLTPLAAGAALAVVLAVPLARPYVAAQALRGDRPASEVSTYSATFGDYVTAHPRSAVYGGRLGRNPQPERALFPGTAAVALALVGSAPPVGPIRLAYAAGLLFAYDMSTGLNGVIYPHLYEWLLPVRAMRVPARFSIILGISLAVLAAFGARRLLGRFTSSGARAALLLALALAVGLDVRPHLRLEPVWPAPPTTYAALDADAEVVLAEIPVAIDGAIDALPQMYFSMWHGRQMVNGYSGFFPPSYQPLLDDLADFPGPVALAALRARGVTHVSVTCALQPAGCDDLLAAIEASPALRLQAAARWEGAPARLYVLQE